jgi:hypothetical protein
VKYERIGKEKLYAANMERRIYYSNVSDDDADIVFSEEPSRNPAELSLFFNPRRI